MGRGRPSAQARSSRSRAAQHTLPGASARAEPTHTRRRLRRTPPPGLGLNRPPADLSRTRSPRELEVLDTCAFKLGVDEHGEPPGTISKQHTTGSTDAMALLTTTTIACITGASRPQHLAVFRGVAVRDGTAWLSQIRRPAVCWGEESGLWPAKETPANVGVSILACITGASRGTDRRVVRSTGRR